MRFCSLSLALAVVVCVARPADAQYQPPSIGPFVADVRLSAPRFPRNEAVAASRNLTLTELPGAGLGLDVNAHVYVFSWKAVTVGLGGQLTLARAHSTPTGASGEAPGRPVTARFTSIAPQLSLNFGSGEGWSYISGGIGASVWSIVPDAATAGPADEERLRTFNYGGGARWFTRPHVAFHFDVRFYVIAPGSPQAALPGSPGTRLLILGAGVSFK